MSFPSPSLQGIVQLSTKHLAASSCGAFNNKSSSTVASAAGPSSANTPPGVKLATQVANWSEKRWSEEFDGLNRLHNRDLSHLSKNIANESYNTYANRYCNVLPYDQTLVRIVEPGEDGEPGEELYINANHVRVTQALGRQYILTQGPLFNLPHQNTIDEFWMMVDQQKTNTIIMLCKCEESNGSELQSKSAQYWPQEVGDTLVLGEVTGGLKVKMTESSETAESRDFVSRSFILSNPMTREERRVDHFHFISWPDFDVPKSPGVFLDFLKEIRDSNVFHLDVGPPILHCSAGIGRSGTLALVDSCLCMAEAGQELTWETVKEVLETLRSGRQGCVQTSQQLRFSVDAILLGLERLGLHSKGGVSGSLGDRKRHSWDQEGGEGGSLARKRKKSIPS